MKKIFFFLIVLPFMIYSQTLNGRVSSSYYSFERYSLPGISQTYVRAYQTMNMSLNKGNFSLKTRIALEGDIVNPLEKDPRIRLYNFILEYRKLFGVVTAKVGRQSLFNSLAGGAYDGVSLKLSKYGISLSTLIGVNVPPYQKIALSDSYKDNYVFYSKLKITAIKTLNLSFSFINKNYKPIEYSAYRLDSLLNPIQYLVRKNSTQFTYVSGEFNFTPKNNLSLFSKLDYDLNFEQISKVVLRGRMEVVKNLGVNLYYNYRAPRIRYNSIFSVFDFANTQEIEAGFDYKYSPTITFNGNFGFVQFKDANSQRVNVGVITRYVSFNYRKTFGFAGELDAFSFSAGKPFLNNLIVPTIGFSYTDYKLAYNENKNKLVSFLAGVNIRPWKRLSLGLQGQYLNNKFYNNDFRVFLRINYWFSTKLGVI